MRLHQGIYCFLTAFLIISGSAFCQEDELDKLLLLNLEDLSHVKVISATKTLAKANEVPATVRVITSETIREHNYLTLEDLLSTLPGFQFRNILGFNSYVFQRGIPNQNNLTLLLIDGIQINELNSGGFYGGGQFNLDNVKQVEVVYGPASALYGTNAVSGIINIITKDPTDDEGLSINGLYGSFNTYQGGAAYSVYDDENELGFRIAAMVKSSVKANLAGAEGDYNWSESMENFEDDYSTDLKAEYKNLKFGLTYQNKQSSRTTNYKSTGTGIPDKNTLWNITFLNTYIKYYHSFSHELDLLSTIYYRDATIADNTVGSITDTSQVGYYRPNQLTGLETMLSYSPLQQLQLIGGVVYKYESLADDYSLMYSNSSSSKPPVPPAPSMTDNSLLSGYLQMDYELFRQLHFFAGARFDHSTIYRDVVTPRAGLVFNEDNIILKLLYSEAFRAPKPWDYNFGSGNPDLKPERIKSYEAAGQYFFMKNLSIDLSIYKNDYSNILAVSSSRFKNLGDIETSGFEAVINYTAQSFKTFINYTFNSSVDINGVPVPEIAKHMAGAGLTFYAHRNLCFSLNAYYFGKRNNPVLISRTGTYAIDGALVVNPSVSYSGLDDLRATFSVNNLLDEKYYHTSNRPPERYRQPQRTLLLKLEYYFHDL